MVKDDIAALYLVQFSKSNFLFFEESFGVVIPSFPNFDRKLCISILRFGKQLSNRNRHAQHTGEKMWWPGHIFAL
jgi:hypothetical protein